MFAHFLLFIGDFTKKVFFIFMFTHITSSACPRQCYCSDRRKSVSCTRHSVFPKDIPGDTKYLYIKDIEVNSIDKGYFERLTHLVSLQLTNISVRYIPTHIFSSLTKLESLTLSYCGLTSIDNLPFKSLKNLIKLDLRGNLLKSIFFHVFYGLDRLNRLFLNGNELQVVNKSLFTYTPRLTHQLTPQC